MPWQLNSTPAQKVPRWYSSWRSWTDAVGVPTVTLRILADENIPAADHYIGDLGEVQRFSGRELRAQQLAGCDALLVRSVTPVDEALLAGSQVRFVGTATSGVDHIDREYLARAGIAFSHAPGSNANSVVEYVLAAIAGVGEHLEGLLAGGRAGVVGYGVIGKAVAARFAALGIDVCCYDPWLAPAAIEQPASWDDILACDVVTVHAELTRASPWPSYHLFDASALAALRTDSLFINASRGPVADNAALAALLAADSGPDVVLDVWEHEPQVDAQLLRKVNIGTPHIAGYSLDGKLLATQMLVAAMASKLDLPWQNPGSAAEAAEPLVPPPGLSDIALLRYLVGARYCIVADDAALRRGVMDMAPAAARKHFDRLRRQYPQRRELLGSPVVAANLTADSRQWLQRLGCKSVESE
jgi:erythronate-4-phosphate dehydrogenase